VAHHCENSSRLFWVWYCSFHSLHVHFLNRNTWELWNLCEHTPMSHTIPCWMDRKFLRECLLAFLTQPPDFLHIFCSKYVHGYCKSKSRHLALQCIDCWPFQQFLFKPLTLLVHTPMTLAPLLTCVYCDNLLFDADMSTRYVLTETHRSKRIRQHVAFGL
jgi:hypothetical protein